MSQNYNHVGMTNTRFNKIEINAWPRDSQDKSYPHKCKKCLNRTKTILFSTYSLLYAESISAWSNLGSVMCLLSILNQYK